VESSPTEPAQGKKDKDEKSPSEKLDTGSDKLTAAQTEFGPLLESRNRQLAAAIASASAKRVAEPGKLAWVTDLSAKSPEVPLLKRGDYFQPGEFVVPGALSALTDSGNAFQLESPLPNAKSTGRRLAFGRWATRPNSRAAALLARVQVDRLWRGHFGQGLVPSPENFGASGVPPTHPELLDWLAVKLIDSGWRQKAVHRAIVLSRAYRQVSTASPTALTADTQNAFYSRFPAHRLEAEQIRDSMLAVADVLNRKSGGPAVDTIDKGNRQIVLPTPTGPGPHEVDRRSIYIRHRRSQPLSFLRVFDQATPEPNCVARGTSTVVAQSLAMLNSEFATRMGSEFANRVLREIGTRPVDEQLQHVFRVALTRDPTAAELLRCREFLRLQTERRQVAAPDLAHPAALADLCRLLLATNEFLSLQ
ncbi:MAG: hypothetical protein JWM11_2206, partial [Planctomycetaceae bacterium]|nr:hypothetical protein [Planctomycetaceae bacterium]